MTDVARIIQFTGNESLSGHYDVCLTWKDFKEELMIADRFFCVPVFRVICFHCWLPDAVAGAALRRLTVNRIILD